jgi:hypothetical protein
VNNIGFTEAGYLVQFTSDGKAYLWKDDSWIEISTRIMNFHDAVNVKVIDDDVPFPCVSDLKYSVSALAQSMGIAVANSLITGSSDPVIAKHAAIQANAKAREERKRDIATLFGSVLDIYLMNNAVYVNGSKGFFKCVSNNDNDVAGTVVRLSGVNIHGHINALTNSGQNLYVGDDDGAVYQISEDGRRSKLINKGNIPAYGLAWLGSNLISTRGVYIERLTPRSLLK